MISYSYSFIWYLKKHNNSINFDKFHQSGLFRLVFERIIDYKKVDLLDCY